MTAPDRTERTICRQDSRSRIACTDNENTLWRQGWSCSATGSNGAVYPDERWPGGARKWIDPLAREVVERRLGLVERGLENADELHLRRCDTTGATILVGRPHAVSGTVCSWERL
jgi:hypothetical protein